MQHIKWKIPDNPKKKSTVLLGLPEASTNGSKGIMIFVFISSNFRGTDLKEDLPEHYSYVNLFSLYCHCKGSCRFIFNVVMTEDFFCSAVD